MSGPRLRLRPAVAADEALFLDWRNAPQIVALGASGSTVSAAAHAAWFAATLTRELRLLLVLELGSQPVGMLRYDADGEACEVSLYLVPPHPGHGLGTCAFLLSLPHLLAWRLHTRRLIARVRADNPRSLRFFRKLGFVPAAGSETGVDRLTLDLADVPHSRLRLEPEDESPVAEVLRSGQLAQGPRVAALEAAWCEAVGQRGAVAVGSGLAALRLGLLALGVGPGDEVIVPGYSCVALLNAPLSLGAMPVLADVTPGNWILAAESVAQRVSPRTRAIVAVHLFGAAAPLGALAQFGLPLLEDCAHGIGGHSDAGRFGAGGAVSMSSFYATKMIGAGEGGIVASRDPALLQRVVRSRDYGDQAADGRHLNDKMTEIEAVLAHLQLRRLADTLQERARLFRAYSTLLEPLREAGWLELPPDEPGRVHYRYALQLRRRRAADVVADMARLGVRAEQPVWDLRGTPHWRGGLPQTDLAFESVLSLPLYPGLSPLEQGRVVATLGHVLEPA